MQSGDSQQGIGGVTSHGRNPSVAPPGRSSSSSSSASPSSSSSSAVSAPHQGVASTHQHLEFRPSLQQQLTEPPEGDEARLAHQAHGLHGGAGGSNSQSSSGPMFLPERPGQFDFFQQLGSEESENNTPGVAQFSAQNPNHEAYMRYAAHAAQQKSLGIMRQQNLGKTGSLGSVPDEDKNAQINNFRSQEHISTEAPNLKHSSALRKPVEHFMHGERQTEQGLQLGSGQRSDSSPFRQVAGVGQIMAGSMMRPMQTPQAEPNVQNQNIVSNQLAVAQFQAMQTWAMENNIDLSLPANANLVPQLFQLWQPRMAAPHKSNESNVATQAPHQLMIKQHVMSSEPVPTDGSARGNSSSDVSGILGPEKSREAGPYGSFAPTSSSLMVNTNNIQMQQLDVESREGRACKQPMMNGVAPMHAAQSSANTSQGIDHCLKATTIATGAESSQAQYFRRLHQLNRSSPQSAVTSSEEDSTYIPSQDGQLTQVSQQRLGFTKKQFHVLKAQILAFRRVNRGDLSLPQEVLRAIVPPPLESQLEEVLDPGTINQERSTNNNVEEHQRHSQSNEVPPRELHMNRGTQSHPGEESFAAEERAAASSGQMQVVAGVMKDHMWKVPVWKEEGNNATFSLNSGQEIDRVGQKIHVKGDLTAERGKAIATEIAVSDAMPVEASTRAGTLSQPKDVGVPRKYSGPLFDSPLFDSKKDSVSSLVTGNNANKLTLAYDVKDILLEEGKELLSKKRSENLKKINGLLAVNLEKKRISPDLVLRLQIEEKKLRLVNLQARMRDEIDQQQQVIMAMPDRPYRKFVKLCERQRMEFARQVQVSQKISRDKQLRSIFLWRKKFLDAHWAIRDARASQNKGVAKYHERMLREFSKRKDEDRNKRMEALKNNDVDRYREMLLEQQTTITGDAAQRYSVLSSFLSQTEEYLHKLGGKITATKNQQEVEDAAAAAAAAARSRGLSDEEVKAAATCAGQEVMTRSRFSEMNAQKNTASVNKYYNLAHAVNEKVSRQPSMLRAGTLRDYQLIGLQWMLSLYNNKLNGILADEMGLGKTVQVMALIAYLMEFKGNYGPHLIIVPNAVLVNWKSELHNWLPSVSCIYYVGTKDQRSRLFSQEVRAMKFNILVTTYEFIMFDRSKLSKIDWKYIVIDEAQRMKDRESVLARDLDRYRCQRRLLLTGTPLQNDLKELWSLLNLLLPEVFDNRKVFHDWFSKPFQKDAPVHESEDDWLETEKKVIIIHRLHQILEPFMLRRRVEDVEGSLPRKVSIVLRCKMSAIQGAIYDWIKSTGTIRVDPEDELMRVQKNPLYQAKTYKTLNNKCMELRKTCNHPLLNYPYFNDYSKDFLVRSCGKLWILDRILIKLHRTGHRVLLFSTMTKLLDILEEYLQWRGLIYRRIDGTTSLEDRESAIVDFNKPDTDCFIFLLSIRAAGRGLNLQSADTVVIYDPDPNPKNEEQAVARAHRIGQKREVKVIYMEAVVDRISSNQKEDEFRSGGSIDSEDDLAGKDRYIGSIESLIRSNIQQYKIDMADEVINAGRFDQRTTHEERRMTLEALLHDEERCQETVHKVPSLQEVNRMIARNEEEVKLFDQMDETLNWAEDMTRYDQVPEWLRTSTREVNAVSLNKKPSKKILTRNAFVEPGDMDKDDCPVKTERKRGRPKGSSSKRSPIYKELEEENDEFSGASRQERNGYSLHDEEGETSEEDGNGAVDATPVPKDQSGEEAPACDGGYEYPRALQDTKSNNLFKKSASSASSSGTLRLAQMGSPSTSAQKFRSLSALDSRSGSLPKGLSDELEDGEIVASGDSQAGLQLSGSLIRDRDYGGGEQSLRPKIKRKRSLRRRPRQIWEKNEDRPNNEKSSHSRGSTSQPGFHSDHDNETQLKNDLKHESFGTPFNRQARSDSATKNRRNILSRKGPDSSKSHSLPKSNRLTSIQVSTENTLDHSREPWDGRAMNSRGTITVANKMSDLVQRKCKNVITKLQRRIYMDGPQTVPLLTDFWKRNESSGCMSGTGGDTLLDLHMIDQCVDRFGYNRVMDFVSDMQSLLKNVTRYFCFSLEVRSEAKKVEDLYFDLMKIEFPETDLRDVEKTVSSSAAMVPFAPSSKQGLVGQVKRKREASPPPKLLQRRLLSADEGVRTRNPVSKFQKESRIGSSSRSPDQSTLGEPQLPSHPGELVICKKRRNEREKSVLKQTTTREPSSSVGRTVRGPGRASPPNAGRGIRGPVPASPPSVGRGVRGPGPNPSQREVKLSQPTAYHQHGWGHQPTQLAEGSGSGSGSEDSGWAKPVKRTRTDTAKKRQSYSHI